MSDLDDKIEVLSLRELFYKITGRNSNVRECRHFQGKSKNEYNQSIYNGHESNDLKRDQELNFERE
jgi:hypothetical protein